MCPKHRKEILRWIKAWLLGKKLVCCVSTALIEAGINVSFPIVVRSWAGIPSLIQAAGRACFIASTPRPTPRRRQKKNTNEVVG